MLPWWNHFFFLQKSFIFENSVLEFCKLKLLLRMHIFHWYTCKDSHRNMAQCQQLVKSPSQDRDGHSSPLWSLKSIARHTMIHSHSFKNLQLCLLNLTAFTLRSSCSIHHPCQIRFVADGSNQRITPTYVQTNSCVLTKTITYNCHFANIVINYPVQNLPAKFSEKNLLKGHQLFF